jgi:hypothetical protein
MSAQLSSREVGGEGRFAPKSAGQCGARSETMNVALTVALEGMNGSPDGDAKSMRALEQSSTEKNANCARDHRLIGQNWQASTGTTTI